MPQTNAAAPGGNNITNYYDDRYVAIIPTPELQELYNTWRQQQELEAHVKEQAQLAVGSSDGGSQHHEYLRPPSAATMSRSPSCASTSNSVTGGMNNMGLSDEKPAKKKQGRQGPLDALGKARAALVRKLHACQNCRSRKVKCSHHNFRLLEDAYQASKRIVPPMAQRPRYNNPENTRAQQEALFGVGVGQNLSIPTSQYISFNEFGEQAAADLDDLLLSGQGSPMSPNSTAPLYFLSGSSRSQGTAPLGYNSYGNYNWGSMPATSIDSSYAYLQQTNSLAQFGAPMGASGTQTPATAPVSDSQADRHIPIGRRITSAGHQTRGYGGYSSSPYGWAGTQDSGQWEWECLFGDDGTASSVSYPYSNYSGSNGAPSVCKRRYNSVEDLGMHFQKEHLPFENGQIYPFCTLHGQHYDYSLVNGCPQCPADGGNVTATSPDGGWYSPWTPTVMGNNTSSNEQFQEQWYFGDVLPRPDQGNGRERSGRVFSEDGGRSGGPYGPLTRSGTITQLNMLNGNIYGGGGGYGSHSAVTQGGGRRRGNSTFAGGDTFSSFLSPDDLQLDPAAHGGGSNAAHRRGDTRVNFVLSPPPSFLKTMPFSSLSSKMLLSPVILPPESETCDTVHTKNDFTLHGPSTAAPNTTAVSKQAQGRGKVRSYCPYYAYGKELFGAETGICMKSASDICSRSSVSISASPRWSSSGSCTSSIFDQSSSSPSAAGGVTLTSPKIILLLSVVLMFILTITHALPTPAPSSSSSTATKVAEKSSVMCVVLGLVGMWLVRRNHRWFRRAKHGLGSHRPPYQRELKDNLLSGVGVTRDHSSPSANTKGGSIYTHAHTHAHVHPQASAAAAG
ncbi:hypothetical protein V8F20_010542 [Naviculisporaceae sp. PSN 640]